MVIEYYYTYYSYGGPGSSYGIATELRAGRSGIEYIYIYIYIYGPVSSVGIATELPGWTVRDRIPVRTRFSARPDRPWGPHSLQYNGYRE